MNKKWAWLIWSLVPAGVLAELSVQPFASLDVNADGFIAQDELQTASTNDFSRADIDRDGRISALEYQTFLLVQSQPGLISGVALLPAFETLDIDRDGVVSQSEYQALLNQLQGRVIQAPVTTGPLTPGTGIAPIPGTTITPTGPPLGTSPIPLTPIAPVTPLVPAPATTSPITGTTSR